MTGLASTEIRGQHRPWGRLALVLLLVVAGCGKKGNPLPPEPRGPFPPGEVQARQIGRQVEVRFRVPPARGPKPARQTVQADLFRVTYPPGPEPAQDPDAFRRRGEIVGSVVRDPLEEGALEIIVDEELDGLSGVGVDSTLRYGVRVRDRRRRSSPLVLATDLVLFESVPPPRGITAEPTADGIRLVWEPPDGAGDFRYNLYRRLRGDDAAWAPINAEPLSRPEYLDDAVRTGKTYTYEARVALAAGVPYREGESGPTIEVLAADLFPPAPPTGLVAVQEGLAVRLFWDPSAERDLAGYRLYRRVDEGPWVRIGPDPIVQPLFLDAEVALGQKLAYRVSAVDRVTPLNESGRSSSVELEILAEPTAPGVPEP